MAFGCSLFAVALFSATATAVELTLVPQVGKLVATGGYTARTNVTWVTDASIRPEGYRLVVSAAGVTVTSSDEAGRFYALQTLRQLSAGSRLPCVEIEDAPAYRWRGALFDDCRHFFGKETIKRFIDQMARHKFNVLHWHLTDDQAWRIEVPGYPELVKYGAQRSCSPVHRSKREYDKGEFVMDTNGIPYGPFFYSEADLREIVAYAGERHITIVPEIELPGHFYAALAAYPEFACRPENLAARDPRCIWGIEKDVMCVGNDKAVKFLEDVLDYVCKVFPSEFVHIGGDECPHVRWKDCPKCQARIKAEGLKDEKGLQGWVTRRVIKFLEARGKRAIGWDEYLHGDVPASAAGMVWRVPSLHASDKVKVLTVPEVAAMGHDVVSAARDKVYFYDKQGLKDDPFEYGLGNNVATLEKAYSFDPSEGVASNDLGRVIGGQCCNWSEFTWNEHDLEWKMWPRGCAVAEALWLGNRKPGYGDFLARMIRHRKRLVREGVNCAPLEIRKTKVLVVFDTEDFTCPRNAEGVLALAKILEEEGIKGHFIIIAEYAKALREWGRTDVIEAMKRHYIGTHTRYHSVHPDILEISDGEDYEAAYKRVYAQESEAVAIIKDVFGIDKVWAAVPPVDCVSYVAMRVYSDMGIPFYMGADAFPDTGKVIAYGGMRFVPYACRPERFQREASYPLHWPEDANGFFDELAHHHRFCVNVHPNKVYSTEFWDALNYMKGNLVKWGEWIQPKERPPEEAKEYLSVYRNVLRRFKTDPRFEIVTLPELLAQEPVRQLILREEIGLVRDAMKDAVGPIAAPQNLCVYDVFAACVNFLRGERSYQPDAAYGFLSKPVGVESPVEVTADELRRAAASIRLPGFLPSSIDLGNGKRIGPADYLFAALEVLDTGAEKVTVSPREQLGSFEGMKTLQKWNRKGKILHIPEFKDEYTADRLRWQLWTMRVAGAE